MPAHLKVCVWQKEERISSTIVLSEKLYNYQFSEEKLVQNLLFNFYYGIFYLSISCYLGDRLTELVEARNNTVRVLSYQGIGDLHVLLDKDCVNNI